MLEVVERCGRLKLMSIERVPRSWFLIDCSWLSEMTISTPGAKLRIVEDVSSNPALPTHGLVLTKVIPIRIPRRVGL